MCAVATVLTRTFEVPPENLVAQGYGQQFQQRNNSGANKRPPSEVEQFYLLPASLYCVQQLRVHYVVGVGRRLRTFGLAAQRV